MGYIEFEQKQKCSAGCGCCKNAGKIQFPSYIQQMRPKTNNLPRSTYTLNMHYQQSEQSDSSDPDTWELPEHNIKFKTHSINQIRQRRRQLAEMENKLKKPNLQQSAASNIMQTANQDKHTDNKQMKVYIQGSQNEQNLNKSDLLQVSQQQQQPMSNAQISQAEPCSAPHSPNFNQMPNMSANNQQNRQDYFDGTHLRRLFHSHQACQQSQQPVPDAKEYIEGVDGQQKQMCDQQNQVLQPQQAEQGNENQIQIIEQVYKQKQLEIRSEKQVGNENQVEVQMSREINERCGQQIDVYIQRQSANTSVVHANNQIACNNEVLVQGQLQSQCRQPQTQKQQNKQNEQNYNCSMPAEQCVGQKQQVPQQQSGNIKSEHSMREFWIQIKPIPLNEQKSANPQLIVVDDNNIEGQQQQQQQASFHNSYHSCHSASIDIAQFLIQPKHMPDSQSGQCQQLKSSVPECSLQQDSISKNLVQAQSKQQQCPMAINKEQRHRSEICQQQQQAQVRKLKQKREVEQAGACQTDTIKQTMLSATEQQELSQSLANYKLTRENKLNTIEQASHIQQQIENYVPSHNKQYTQQQSQSHLPPESQTNINSHTQKPKFEQPQPQHQDQRTGKHEAVIEKQPPNPKITLSNALPILCHDKKKQIQLKKQIKSARKSTHPPKIMQSPSKPILVNLKLMKNIIVIDDDSISGADSVIEIANVDTNTRSKDRQEGQISDHQDERQGEQLDERKTVEKMKIQQIRRRLCAAINQQPRQNNEYKKDPRQERRKQKLGTTGEHENQKWKKQVERQKQKLKNKQKQKFKQ